MENKANMKKDWIETFTGKNFYPLAPELEKIDIEDIAHALSNICRYTGHCKYFYSVAQHSVIVAELLSKQGASYEVQFAGLMHDATEAYLCDIAKPVKNMIPGYSKAEHALADVIGERFEIDNIYCKDVEAADVLALGTEARQLMNGKNAWWENIDYAPGFKIDPVFPAVAKQMFLDRFHYLNQMRKEALDK